MKKMSVDTVFTYAIPLAIAAIRQNQEKMGERPESDEAGDRWDEIDCAMEDLEGALDSFEDEYNNVKEALDLAKSVRPSVGRVNIQF